MPQRLELNDRAGDLVVHLDTLAAIFRVGQLVHVAEVVHRPLDAAHELPRPHDVARDWRCVAHMRRARLELLVGAHHRLEVGVVMLKNGRHLGVKIVLQALTLQDLAELHEHLQRRFGRRDVLKRRVNIRLQRRLELVNVGKKFEIVTIELVGGKVEEVVRLALEIGDHREEIVHQPIHPLEVVLGEHSELVDGRKEIDQLLDAPMEKGELAENHILIEIELLTCRLLGQACLGRLVALAVRIVQLDTRLELSDQLRRRLLPHVALLVDILAAIDDHLLCDLHEEYRHLGRRGIVARDGVHHPDVVH
mmetsp:Transcript_13186/g.38881  ORF Transcript_13186/g.38881 Transcript_13186/m.38881 type:complete len:307 (+) Transcript_13186:3818-4738(+)